MNVWLDNKKNSETIELADYVLASGGEAQLYAIQTPGYEQLIAKIYHPSKRTKLREDKLQYLLANRPKSSHPDTHLIWPKQKIYNEQQAFIGFLMPYFKGEKLEILCLPKLAKKFRSDWKDFDFELDNKRLKRLHLGYLIASAMNDLHQLDDYVLVDFKPDNIVINTQGQLAFVDLDSIEVVEEGQTVFDAPVATPEYSPPDSYLKNPLVDPTQEDPWDRFSLAVILYKILVGIHPYAATATAPYEEASNLHQKIEHGLFVHHPEKQAFLSIVPQQHEAFETLPYQVQRLFLRCFIEGHHQPFARPSAEEWTQALQHFDTSASISNEAPPALPLQFLPDNLNISQLFKLPDLQLVSPQAKLKIEQSLSPTELQTKQLSPEFIDPKELKAQRFFNFTATLMIVVVCAAISILIPWKIASSIAILAYLGINYLTFKNRKTAERKDHLNQLLKHQMDYFHELVESAEQHESSMTDSIDLLKSMLSKISPKRLEDMMSDKEIVQQKLQNFKKSIEQETLKVEDLKRCQKKEFRLLQDYYNKKIKALEQLPKLEAKTLLQLTKEYKRAKRLGLLTEVELAHYSRNLEQLESLLTQYNIEQDAWKYKGSERIKDIQFRCEQWRLSIVEEIEIFNQSVSKEDIEAVESLVKGYRETISAFERLSYDVERLKIPIQQQLEVCQKTKIDVALYQNINFGSHLLNMIGIG